MTKPEDDHNKDGDMPSFEDGSQATGSPAPQDFNEGPEPPLSWKPAASNQTQHNAQQPRIAAVGKHTFALAGNDAELFNSGRKLITAAQICAIVSLFIGGVLVSAIGLIVAIVGYRKMTQISQSEMSQPFNAAIKRSGIVAIVFCSLALVLNTVSFIVFYPMVMEMMQSGDMASLFTGGSPTSAGSSTSTWG